MSQGCKVVKRVCLNLGLRHIMILKHTSWGMLRVCSVLPFAQTNSRRGPWGLSCICFGANREGKSQAGWRGSHCRTVWLSLNIWGGAGRMAHWVWSLNSLVEGGDRFPKVVFWSPLDMFMRVHTCVIHTYVIYTHSKNKWKAGLSKIGREIESSCVFMWHRKREHPACFVFSFLFLIRGYL